MKNALESLLTRRSTGVKELDAPGPNEGDLTLILQAATRVPDHGKLGPWKIKILRKNGQDKLGGICADLFKKQHPDASEAEIANERGRFARAPLVLAVIYTPVESQKAPAWEQMLSTGAVCMNMLHAAHALGYGAKWLTEWPAYYDEVKTALGGSANDKIAGFIYLGTKKAQPEERERPKLGDVVSEW